MSRRLKELHEEQQRNIERVKYFCLEPTLDNFKAVVRPRVVTEECFDAWRTAALYKFSSDWGIDLDPDTGDEINEDKFLDLDNTVCKGAISAPTRTNCEKLMFIFYATGELKYIDLFYQCMGIVRSRDVQKYLTTLFTETREGYSERIFTLIAADKTHFDNINVCLGSVDFSYFDKPSIDKFRQIAKDKKIACN